MKQLVTLGIVGMLGLVFLFMLSSSAITGNFVITGEPHPTVLDDIVTQFFNTESVQFPSGNCGTILSQLYSDIAFTPMDTRAGFTTATLTTLNFVIDRTARMGTLDLGKGRMLTNGAPADGFINIDTSAIVRVPKALRATNFRTHLYGLMGKSFTITHGAFSTPSVDCTFTTDNGKARCTCESHAQEGLEEASVSSSVV